jgi:hypothetical protein
LAVIRGDGRPPGIAAAPAGAPLMRYRAGTGIIERTNARSCR